MRDFDGLSAAEADELRPILDAFERITWPAPVELAPVFAEELGWRMIRDRAAETNLPVSWRHASFLLMKDGFEEVQFAVTDSLTEELVGDADRQAALRAAYAAEKTIMRELLGEKSGSRGGKFPTMWWDLSSGGRVHLAWLGMTVMLKLLSKSAADLERDESRLGISPDRVVR